MTEASANHPYLPFRELSQSFARKNIRSRLKIFLFLKAVAVWRWVYSIDRAERAIKRDMDQGRDGFWHDTWIFKSLFYPEISASFILEPDGEADPIRKAAQAVHGALLFRSQLLNKRVTPEYESGRPQDMGRYRYLFSRITISSLQQNKMRHVVTDFPASREIIVAIEGAFYTLQVIGDDGHALPYREFYRQISALVEHARTYKKSSLADQIPFGLLTVLHNRCSARLFQSLTEENRSAIDRINQALFLVAIDINDCPASMDKNFRSIHCENYHNRDHRRSMQIVITGNGRVGVVVNPHAGIGGSLSAKFASEIYKTCQALASDGTDLGQLKSETAKYERLDLKSRNLGGWQKTIESLERKVLSQISIASQKCSFRIDGVGADDFKKQKVSADAAFHCGLQLAYYRVFGKIPSVGNFINLRTVKYGDIWRYECNSDDMRRFILNPDAASLRAAMQKHKELIKYHKAANDEFYLGARTLFRLINQGDVRFSAFVMLMLMGKLFIKDFIPRFISPDIWVSHIPEFEGVEIAGRAGVQLSYLEPDGLGGHFMMFPDHVKVCLPRSSRRHRRQLQEGEFERELQSCLLLVMELSCCGRSSTDESMI